VKCVKNDLYLDWEDKKRLIKIIGGLPLKNETAEKILYPPRLSSQVGPGRL
jgi:hypothetical protein